MMPCTWVLRQYSRHHGMSYRSGSFSVMLVCPHRQQRLYHGGFWSDWAVVVSARASNPVVTMKSRRLGFIASPSETHRISLRRRLPRRTAEQPARSSKSKSLLKNPKNRLLTRAAQNRDLVFPSSY